MNIEIRAYKDSDAPSLIAIFRDAARSTAGHGYSEEQVRAWAPDDIDLARFAATRGAKPTWIAELAGRIAGFSDLEPNGHVDMLYVHPKFQRRGIASALLSHIELLALEQKLKLLFTEASIVARRVFERHGFVVLTEQTVMVRNIAMTNYRMEKCLKRTNS